MNNSKERRKEIRIPLLAESILWIGNGQLTATESQVLDISKSGVFIKSANLPGVGSSISVSFKLPGDLGILNLKGTVAWRRWTPNKKIRGEVGFGVSFDHLDKSKEKIMDAYCIYMRNKQIIAVSKKIVEEFFSKRPVI